MNHVCLPRQSESEGGLLFTLPLVGRVDREAVGVG
jgi:hypothetical protein